MKRACKQKYFIYPMLSVKSTVITQNLFKILRFAKFTGNYYHSAQQQRINHTELCYVQILSSTMIIKMFEQSNVSLSDDYAVITELICEGKLVSKLLWQIEIFEKNFKLYVKYFSIRKKVQFLIQNSQWNFQICKNADGQHKWDKIANFPGGGGGEICKIRREVRRLD